MNRVSSFDFAEDESRLTDEPGFSTRPQSSLAQKLVSRDGKEHPLTSRLSGENLPCGVLRTPQL